MEKVEAKKFEKCLGSTKKFNNCQIKDLGYGQYEFITFQNENHKREWSLVHLPWYHEIEQISDNEFYLINYLASGNKELFREQISKEGAKTLYKKVYENCYELSDDLMLFEIRHLRSSIFPTKEVKDYSVYSLKENNELESFNWLSSGYDVTPTKTDEGKIVLHITKELVSDQGNDYVQFLVDSQNFEPISNVHSTLRDSYIDVSTKEDVQKIVKEDTINKTIVDSKLSSMSEQSKEQAAGELFSRK